MQVDINALCIEILKKRQLQKQFYGRFCRVE